MVFTLLLIVKILTIIRIFTKIYFTLFSKIPAKYTNAECIGQFNSFYLDLPQLADFFLRGYLETQTTFLNHIKTYCYGKQKKYQRCEWNIWILAYWMALVKKNLFLKSIKKAMVNNAFYCIY